MGVDVEHIAKEGEKRIPEPAAPPVKRQSLLEKGLKVLKEYDQDQFLELWLQDEDGRYAAETTSFILGAKSQFLLPSDKYEGPQIPDGWGAFVSMHRPAIIYAQNKGKLIAFYIESLGKVLFFFPSKLLKEGVSNVRPLESVKKNVEMVNFPISWAQKFYGAHQTKLG